ncbi:MAG TPA: AAC(3) family N-acetyltransferase [Blastococcus sp.]|jgi:aminoglycoside 3-N-acetyltransferase|nr:AAC(3) family N-acetyltransferase [Blastococcus sp.]
MHVLAHSSLSSLGPVQGGAAAVVDSLRNAIGADGTLVVPSFTPHVADSDPDWRGVPDAAVRARREAVPVFTPDLPSPMGAIAEDVRRRPEAVRSRHPQASVAALGAHAQAIVADQPLHFALGAGSPFARLADVDGRILLIGVGHNRNSFLHHAETFVPHRRLKQRRFPVLCGGERVWCETLDVGDDNDTHFPVVGGDFERYAGTAPTTVAGARVVLLAVQQFVPFAIGRLTELLAADRADQR